MGGVSPQQMYAAITGNKAYNSLTGQQVYAALAGYQTPEAYAQQNAAAAQDPFDLVAQQYQPFDPSFDPTAVPGQTAPAPVEQAPAPVEQAPPPVAQDPMAQDPMAQDPFDQVAAPADTPMLNSTPTQDQPQQAPVVNSAPAGAPAAPAAAAPQDPWAEIAQSYGLGGPPAVGTPAVLPHTNIGAAPQGQTALIDPSSVPQPQAAQMSISPEVQAMMSGEGYSPDILAKMKANAVQNASAAGIQQMSQTKRQLGANGIKGGANAAVVGDVARQTGQNERNALGQIDISNAQVGNENKKFGIGQQTGIGQSNMQAANAMAMENASKLFTSLQTNAAAQNNTNQMNTGFQFQRQENQANMDNNTNKSQWDELNKRFSQSQNILGQWGAA